MKNSKYSLSGVFCLTASLMMFSASQSQGAVGETFLEDEDSVFKFTVLTEEGSTGTVAVGRSVMAGYNISGNITIPSSASNNGIRYRVTAIAADGFRGRDKLISVTIPDSVTTIGEDAFCNCANLQTVEIPDSVTTIGNSAFYGCHSLSSIEIPGSVSILPYQLFRSCKALTDVVLGDGVTIIAQDAFGFCSSLTHLTIPDSVTDIVQYAFQYSALESIVIPASVKTLGKNAFTDCTNLQSVYFEGDMPETGWTIYWDTPETLLTYYPTGNATWEAEIKDGMWRDRKVANWTPAPQPGNEISFTPPDPETGVLTLTFTGTLEESDDMVNWTPVPNAKGSYDVDIKAGQKKFYRFVK